MRAIDDMKRTALALVAAALLSTGDLRAELARGTRPDELGLAQIYSMLALPGGDLVAFGRDEILRGKVVLLPAGGASTASKTLVVLDADEAARVRFAGMAGLGAFPLGFTDRNLRAVVLLYQVDDSTPYWKQSETKMEVLVVSSDLLSKTSAPRLGLTSVALKGADPQSRWLHPGGESDDPALAEDPPGFVSRVTTAPVDIDGNGWNDLVVWVDECVSALKAAAPSGAESNACPPGFLRRPVRALAFTFDPAKLTFAPPHPLAEVPLRPGSEIHVGEPLEERK